MIPRDRLEKWTSLAAETANLVRDYCVAYAGDDGAGAAKFAIRMASVRGQVNALTTRNCPIGTAWDAAADFLAIVRLFVDETATPALRLQLVDRVTVAAERLTRALADGERTRADVDG